MFWIGFPNFYFLMLWRHGCWCWCLVGSGVCSCCLSNCSDYLPNSFLTNAQIIITDTGQLHSVGLFYLFLNDITVGRDATPNV